MNPTVMSIGGVNYLTKTADFSSGTFLKLLEACAPPSNA